MSDLHNECGRLVRAGPNEVSVSDLTAIKVIYGALVRALYFQVS